MIIVLIVELLYMINIDAIVKAESNKIVNEKLKLIQEQKERESNQLKNHWLDVGLYDASYDYARHSA